MSSRLNGIINCEMASLKLCHNVSPKLESNLPPHLKFTERFM